MRARALLAPVIRSNYGKCDFLGKLVYRAGGEKGWMMMLLRGEVAVY